MPYSVKDSLGKMDERTYFTAYHAAQMARALNMKDGTWFQVYYVHPRFSVEFKPATSPNRISAQTQYFS